MPPRLSAVVRSLRFRLMLWNAGAVLLTGLLILLAVRQGVRYTLIYDLDQVLREDGNEILLHFSGEKGYDWHALQEELNRKAVGHDFHDWFVQFYDTEGRPTWSSVGAPQVLFPAPQARRQRAYTAGAYRLSFRELPPGIDEASSLVVGCSESFVARDMERIDWLVTVVAAIVLCAAPLAGWVLTSRVILPLAQMTRTTARLKPRELHQRLPIRGTGDELDRLAETINGMLDRIAAYLAQEHDFVASAAHELRTPLAAIRSSVEVALATNRSSEEYRELLGLVIEECSALQTLVNQLLLLAETDADRLQAATEPVALDELVLQSVAMFEAVAEDHGIVLQTKVVEKATVLGSRHRLRQVLNNLLDNAIKFTALAETNTVAVEGGSTAAPPRIEISLARNEAERQARLTVRDTGIGIPPEHLPHIFDRFYRVDRSRRRDGLAGGTGLGLSICKAIVEAHHGRIAVHNASPPGTLIEVTLPLAADHR